MAKSVLLSAVLYPVYQNTGLRVEKLPTIGRGLGVPKNFASDRQVWRSHQPCSGNFGLGY
ncbi:MULTISPECIES: hypothetical protein [unclassified Microcoleus]|uniref:hypothetical protein n=1 Tax=unclassified Microcoleus TaxID=2642155 RepID=UPI002FD3350B